MQAQTVRPCHVPFHAGAFAKGNIAWCENMRHFQTARQILCNAAVCRTRHPQVGFRHQQHVAFFQVRMRAQSLQLGCEMSAAFDIPGRKTVAWARRRGARPEIGHVRRRQNLAYNGLNGPVRRMRRKFRRRAASRQFGKYGEDFTR